MNAKAVWKISQKKKNKNCKFQSYGVKYFHRQQLIHHGIPARWAGCSDALQQQRPLNINPCWQKKFIQQHSPLKIIINKWQTFY